MSLDDNTLSGNQRLLLEAVNRGDVGSVRGMLLADDLLEYDYDLSSPSPDVNLPDEQNQTAISIAINSKDLGKQKCLYFLFYRTVFFLEDIK